ncbi:MAG: FkbM family methyltransferase [Verrucomicrobiota bacterium]
MKFRDFLNLGLRPFGSELQKTGLGSDWKRDAKTLLGKQNPNIIFDLGANEGQTLRQIVPHFPSATIHSFEPFPSSFETLNLHWGQHTRIHLWEMALGEASGESALYLSDDHPSNSLLSYHPEFQKNSEPPQTIQVPVTTLDDFCEQHQISQIDLLKMDCQGYELNILKGAQSLLEQKKISVIYSEVILIPQYNQQAYIDELIAYLRIYDYGLITVYDGNRGCNGTLKWSNALFAPRSNPL